MSAFKSVIIVIYLTTLVNCYRVEYLCNKPNWRRQWGVVLNQAEQCLHGVVADVCNQGFVCRKGIGQHCGGHFNYAGVCGIGLSCVVKQVPTNPGTCQKYNSTSSSNLPLCSKDRKTSCRLPISSLSHNLGKTNIPPTILYKPPLPQSSNISSKRPLPNKQQLPVVKLPQQNVTQPSTGNKQILPVSKLPQSEIKQTSTGNKRPLLLSKLPQTGAKQPATGKKPESKLPQQINKQLQDEINVSKNGKSVAPATNNSLKTVANDSEIASESNETTTPSPSYASIILNGLLKAKKDNSSKVVSVSRSGENVSATSYASVGNSSKNLLSMLAKGFKYFGRGNASSNPQNLENQNGTKEKAMAGSVKNVSSNPRNVDSKEPKDNVSQQIKGSSNNASSAPKQVDSNKNGSFNPEQNAYSNPQNASLNPQNASSNQQNTDSNPQNAYSNPQNASLNQQNADSNPQNASSNQQNTNSNQPNADSNQQNGSSPAHHQPKIQKKKADASHQNNSSGNSPPSSNNSKPTSKKRKAPVNWLKVFESLFGLKSKIEAEEAVVMKKSEQNPPAPVPNAIPTESKINFNQMPNSQNAAKPAGSSPISNAKVEPEQDNSSSILQEALNLGSAEQNSNVNAESDEANSKKTPILQEATGTTFSSPSPIANANNIKKGPGQNNSNSNLQKVSKLGSAAPNSNVNVESDKTDSNKIPILQEGTKLGSPASISNINNIKEEPGQITSSSAPNLPDQTILNSATPISNVKVKPIQENSISKSTEAAKLNNFTPVSSEKGEPGQDNSKPIPKLKEEIKLNGATPISNVKVEPIQENSISKSPEAAKLDNFAPISSEKGDKGQANSKAIPKLKEETKFNGATPMSNVKVEPIQENSISKSPEAAKLNNVAPISSEKEEPGQANSKSIPNLQEAIKLNGVIPISNVKVEPTQANSNSMPNLPGEAKLNSFAPISRKQEEPIQTNSKSIPIPNSQEVAMLNNSPPKSNIKVEPEKTLTPNSNFQAEAAGEKINPLSNSVQELKQADNIQTRNFNLETNQNFKPMDTCVF